MSQNLGNQSVCPCCGGDVSSIDLLFDDLSHTISYRGNVARLTGRQYQFAKTLLQGYPRVLTKQNLLDAIYPDPDHAPESKIIDVFACRLRQLLSPLGLTIETIWGIGYRLLLDDEGREELSRLRRQREAQHRRSAFETADVEQISILRAQGYPVTDIARRLGLTLRATMTALDAIEAAKNDPSDLKARAA